MTIVVDVLPPIKLLCSSRALDRMAIEQSGTMRQRKTDAPPAPLLLLLSPLSADPRAYSPPHEPAPAARVLARLLEVPCDSAALRECDDSAAAAVKVWDKPT